jgi:hypothetical protein
MKPQIRPANGRSIGSQPSGPSRISQWFRPFGARSPGASSAIGQGRSGTSSIRTSISRLIVCPDWSLAVPELAESGDLHFIRWIATGTGPDGRFEFNGCDRVRTNASGQVCENYIFCDHPFLRANLRFSWRKQTHKPGAELIDHGVFIDLSSPATHRLPHSLIAARCAARD